MTEEIYLNTERGVDESFCLLINHIFKVCMNLKKLMIEVTDDYESYNDIASELELITWSPLNLEEIRGCYRINGRKDKEQLY